MDCAQCGVDLRGKRVSGAKFCMPCAQQRSKSRIAHPDRIRNCDLTQARHPEGGFACRDCGEKLHQPVFFGVKRRPSLRCSECRAERDTALDIISGRFLARKAVTDARKSGALGSPEAHACADCGRTAECYDHRDYNEPLAVDPVCRSCNVMRGHAAPFNPYLVGLLLAQFVQAAQSGVVGADPSGFDSLDSHGLKHAQPSHSTPLN